MIREKLQTRNGKRFLCVVAIAFIAAVAVVGRATFGGVVREYNLPYSEWTTGMFALQGAMVFIYSVVFTILISIPFGFILLGSDEQKHGKA
ncbi:MAG: DUF2534 family protein [Yokenella regensburgei]|jgi:uncharacterized membrane protein|uniref:Protein of uncharacterized function (DUF2534) n=1 Tax=Yokenella regensburgei TaxID=158877 RepID=A0AB38FSS0_9ENTR|nr:DUF2534 family protein [Yokenella regensburgei]EHM47340.1 hypothetical protein HMPREF0880_03087 [Yokenella regensburgei ATCC 43003]KFD19981.1 putative inner membrane protein [Yokenella regensburgei ATCC 49455]MDQ4431804.1 DUF2534 family protein [Yokenella regensburgei]MDR3105593.1 DUF2534 family protein [Yokenella regensburgei]QIU88544.1 DUF2534 family protein [Yokenella regensburgei]